MEGLNPDEIIWVPWFSCSWKCAPELFRHNQVFVFSSFFACITLSWISIICNQKCLNEHPSVPPSIRPSIHPTTSPSCVDLDTSLCSPRLSFCICKMGISSITWWMVSAMNGQAMYQRQRRVSVNFVPFSSFLSISHPTPPGKSKRIHTPTDLAPSAAGSDWYSLYCFSVISRILVSWEDHREWGVKNNINKLNRKAGGQRGLRSGVQGREEPRSGQSEPLSFQPPEWKILQRSRGGGVRDGVWELAETDIRGRLYFTSALLHVLLILKLPAEEELRVMRRVWAWDRMVNGEWMRWDGRKWCTCHIFCVMMSCHPQIISNTNYNNNSQ